MAKKIEKTSFTIFLQLQFYHDFFKQMKIKWKSTPLKKNFKTKIFKKF